MKHQRHASAKQDSIGDAHGRLRSIGFGIALLVGSSSCTGTVDDEKLGESTLQSASLPLQNAFVLPNSAPTDGAVQLWIWGQGPHDAQARWHQCSGQVISQNTLLTAAHCFHEAGMQGETGTKYVAVNQYVGNNSWQYLHSGTYFAGDVFVHPDFLHGGQFDWSHDAAVLRAPSNWLNIDSDAAPLIITHNWGTFEAWAIGYGDYGPNASDTDSKLRGRQLEVKYVSEFGEYQSNTTEPQLCSGDSGGPLTTWSFSVPMLHGIANSSVDGGPGDCGTTGRWAPTAANWQFIADVVGTCNNGLSWIYCW